MRSIHHINEGDLLLTVNTSKYQAFPVQAKNGKLRQRLGWNKFPSSMLVDAWGSGSFCPPDLHSGAGARNDIQKHLLRHHLPSHKRSWLVPWKWFQTPCFRHGCSRWFMRMKVSQKPEPTKSGLKRIISKRTYRSKTILTCESRKLSTGVTNRVMVLFAVKTQVHDRSRSDYRMFQRSSD